MYLKPVGFDLRAHHFACVETALGLKLATESAFYRHPLYQWCKPDKVQLPYREDMDSINKPVNNNV